MNSRKSLAALAAALLACAAPALAQTAKKPSDHTVEDFFRLGQFTEMELSPNGQRLSALAPLKGRNNLVVLDLGTRKPNIITSFEKLDVANVVWVNNDRLCFLVADGQEMTGQQLYRGTYCINHDGSDLRDFTRLGVRDASAQVGGGGYTNISFIARTYDGSPDMIMAARLRSRDSVDLYRFNTSTGRYQLITEQQPPTGWVVKWVLDRNNVPRVAVSQPKREGRNRVTQHVWYRDSADAKWEKIADVELAGFWPNGKAFNPLAFDYDNSTLYVAAHNGKDKQAIYRYDTRARKFADLAFGHTLVDVEGGLVFSRTQKKLLGARFHADKPVAAWVDEGMARLQRQVDATLPKTANLLVLPAETDDRVLIFSSSDVDPGTYHLMNRVKPSLETLVKTREWLDPNAISERKFIQYTARDGRSIPAYVTIPKGTSGKNLPLIVNIHGGPWTRSYTWNQWNRWPEAQFFASRGYVVLEPEPRGSTGWGYDHFASSFKQWGQAMQDDLTDGALHLVKEGIVDKGRMCLHGGSYGGYAAAMGVVKDPDLWKCAAPFIAVTDLTLFQNVTYSDISRDTDFFQNDFKFMVGDSDADKEMFRKYSPNLHASSVKVPILLTMGGDDVRVPQVHGDQFRGNLESAGKKVEYVVYPGEGHGYNKPENVYDFYRRLEKFYATHLK